MKYSVLEIAKYIITYCEDSNAPISNLKLQQILYFLQAEYYKTQHKPIFDEDICAWKFGPVVPDVYYEFCYYGGSSIIAQYTTTLDEKDKEIINSITDKLKNIPVWKLIQETNASETPWATIFNTYGDRAIIPQHIFKQFF